MKLLVSTLVMKYKVDEWVGYCSLPDIELFKNEREPAVVLDILDDDIFYDYKIYIEKTGKTKKVREHQLFPITDPTY